MCKAPVRSSPPTNQHPTLYRPDALPVAQPTVSEHCMEMSVNLCDCVCQLFCKYGQVLRIITFTKNSQYQLIHAMLYTRLLLCNTTQTARFLCRGDIQGRRRAYKPISRILRIYNICVVSYLSR